MSKKTLNEDFIEEKFFDEDQDDDEDSKEPVKDQDEEIDPLDLYMQEVNNQVKKDIFQPQKAKVAEIYENDDPVETQYMQIKKNIKIQKQHPNQTLKENEKAQQNSESYDSDDIDQDDQKKKKIDPLSQIDLSKIKFEEFNKTFYVENEEISQLTDQQVDRIRKDLQIRVKGEYVCRPIISFAHLGFDEDMMQKISSKEFSKPTPIQAQALPCILNGRDVIGVAKTGSGKTLAYVWPMLVHILDQREVQPKEGPIALIIVPTRELGQQVYLETKKFAKIYGINVSAILGGENKRSQWKELLSGVDIVIATPGRLIDMIKKKATNLNRCTYLVVDEADSMFSLGFEYQIRSIINNIRKDRQTLLFTATMKKKVQQICIDILQNPIIIHIGDTDNAVNEDIKQIAIIAEDEEYKLKWILQNINTFLQRGKVLIFVSQIGHCEWLANEISSRLSIHTLTLHGDKLQQERTQIINAFKSNKNLLIATDVASRGLDIKEIRTVINFHPPKDADIYIHRIGRTGRAGNTDGIAYTIVQKDDWKTAILMIKNLELVGQVVSQELEQIAMIDEGFKVDRVKKKMGLEYAKGKDASKMLKQALKRQRNSNQKAGLGYEETVEEIQKKQKEQEQKKKFNNLWEIPQPQKKIQLQPFQGIFQQGESDKNQFGGKWQELNPIQHDITAYAQSVGINPNLQRDEILAHYSNKMKQKFRSSFVSAGEINQKQNGPRVSFINPLNKSNNQQEKQH